jgi:hypothetical protein
MLNMLHVKRNFYQADSSITKGINDGSGEPSAFETAQDACTGFLEAIVIFFGA